MSTLGRFGLLTVVALVLALLAAHPAFTSEDDGGGGGTRSLMGEDFLAQDVSVTADCNPGSVSTVHFSANGVTPTPPYPGHWFVSGTAKIGPQEPDGAIPGTAAGPVLSLSESFVIFSPLGTVFGTKTLPADLDPSVSEGTCVEVTDFPGSGTVVVVSTQPRYKATIHEPVGTFRDRGDALLSFTEVDLDTGRIAGFDQFFLQSDPAPPPGGDDDD